MQIIDRREQESLVIDNRIEVRVLEVRLDCVRLAITNLEDETDYREETIYFENAGSQLELLTL